MNGLQKFAKDHPEVAALLRRFIMMVLLGHSPEERNSLLTDLGDLDGDGDVDAEDAAIAEAKKATKRPPKKAAK